MTDLNPDGLAAWILAQCDDVERIARAAAEANRAHDDPALGGYWEYKSGWQFIRTVEVGAEVVGPVSWSSMVDDETAAHIVLHDPGSALLVVDAHRRIVAHHSPANRDDPADDRHCAGCGDMLPCPTLRYLGVAYSGRAGYREEWQP